MAIKYIDAISVDGAGSSVDRKLFGGYIHNLSYRIGVAGDKSEVVVNLWSEDGDYSITKSDLNWSKLYKINIGNNISFNGYLVKYKLDKSDRKTLELKFADTSVALDRYFIGLKNRHGKRTDGNIIIVGREFHPCDRDFDGDIDSIPDTADKCHPCRNQASKEAEFRLVNCKQMNKYEIFDVKYNFTMLIAELRKTFKVQFDLKDPNPKYFKSETGTVRDVLGKWCADFGWIFYWEDDTIKFFDIRKTIQIDKNISKYGPNLSGLVEECSVEDTFEDLVTTYYQRTGVRDEYNCNDALYLEVPIYAPDTINLGAELQITNKIPHIAAGLIQYSEDLRDLWYWFDHYNLRKPRDYFVGKRMHKVGLEILSSPIMLDGSDASMSANSISLDGASGLSTSSLEPSTGLNKPNGMPSLVEPTSTVDFLRSSPPTAALQNVKAMILRNKKYKTCFELMKPEDQWVVANGLAANPKDYFFFIGYYDESLHNEHKNIEKKYGASFLNKYHVLVPDMRNSDHRKFFEDYTFTEDEVCGVKVKTNDTKISYGFLGVGGDALSSFFNAPSVNSGGDINNLAQLPFHRWLKIFRDSQGSPDTTEEEVQRLATQRAIMFRLLLVEKSNSSFYPSPENRHSGEEDDKPPKDEIKNERLKGLAGKNALIRLQERNNEAGEFVPRKLLEDMATPLDKSIDRSKVFIFLGRAVSDTDYRVVTQNSINPSSPPATLFNGSPKKTNFQDEHDIQGTTFYTYESLKCKPLGNILPFCYRRSFKTPVATFTYYEPTYSNYGVVIEKNKHIDHEVQKLQMPIWKKKKLSKNVSRIRVVEKDVSDEEIRIFKNERNTCRYDIAKILKYHETISNHLGAIVDFPTESATFTVEGVDISDTPKIKDGLVGVDISMDSSGGITSTYTLGTYLFRKAELDTLIGLDESTSRQSYFNSRPPTPHKKTL